MRNLFYLLVRHTLLLFLVMHHFLARGQYGADANPTGNPIGGGLGYSEIFTVGDYNVSNLSELATALDLAQSGEVVYVDQNAIIDLTGYPMLIVGDGVTVAGNRGELGADGPLLFTTAMSNSSYLFEVHDGSRITGLRIEGPDVDFTEITYPVSPFGPNELSDAKCISVRGIGVDIDNCEISNFHRVGVDAQKNTRDLNVHHNYLHDIHAYPVLVVSRTSMPIIIEANIIEWIWHATAGTGAPGTGYEARYNIFIAKPIPDSWYSAGSHAIDMHPDNDIKDSRGDLVAADYLEIHHNTFIDESGTHPSIDDLEDVKVRGVPRIMASFYRNIFQNSDPALAITYSGDPGNLWVYDNLYGQSSTPIPVAMETTPQILFTTPPPPERILPEVQAPVVVDININCEPSLSLQSVTIELDGQVVYSAPNAPAAGDLILQYQDFDTNLSSHELKVMATDSRGVVGTHETDFLLSSVLPIELSWFQCKLGGNGIELDWETFSETNSEGFEVLKSINGKDWFVLTSVQASGNSRDPRQYSVVDLDPYHGLNYYRLKMIDLDGSYEYSSIQTLLYDQRFSDLIVYPTQTSQKISIDAQPNFIQSRFRIYTSEGLMVKSGILENSRQIIDVSGLEPGTHFIVFNQEKRLLVRKFIKIR